MEELRESQAIYWIGREDLAMQRSTPPRFVVNTIVRHRSTQRQGRILGSYWVPERRQAQLPRARGGGQPPEQGWRELEHLTLQGPHNLDLQRVFVELTIGAQAPDKTSPDPLRSISQELRTGRHDIWSFLAAEKPLF